MQHRNIAPPMRRPPPTFVPSPLPSPSSASSTSYTTCPSTLSLTYGQGLAYEPSVDISAQSFLYQDRQTDETQSNGIAGPSSTSAPVPKLQGPSSPLRQEDISPFLPADQTTPRRNQGTAAATSHFSVSTVHDSFDGSNGWSSLSSDPHSSRGSSICIMNSHNSDPSGHSTIPSSAIGATSAQGSSALLILPPSSQSPHVQVSHFHEQTASSAVPPSTSIYMVVPTKARQARSRSERGRLDVGPRQETYTVHKEKSAEARSEPIGGQAVSHALDEHGWSSSSKIPMLYRKRMETQQDRSQDKTDEVGADFQSLSPSASYESRSRFIPSTPRPIHFSPTMEQGYNRELGNKTDTVNYQGGVGGLWSLTPGERSQLFTPQSSPIGLRQSTWSSCPASRSSSLCLTLLSTHDLTHTANDTLNSTPTNAAYYADSQSHAESTTSTATTVWSTTSEPSSKSSEDDTLKVSGFVEARQSPPSSGKAIGIPRMRQRTTPPSSPSKPSYQPILSETNKAAKSTPSPVKPLPSLGIIKASASSSTPSARSAHLSQSLRSRPASVTSRTKEAGGGTIETASSIASGPPSKPILVHTRNVSSLSITSTSPSVSRSPSKRIKPPSVVRFESKGVTKQLQTQSLQAAAAPSCYTSPTSSPSSLSSSPSPKYKAQFSRAPMSQIVIPRPNLPISKKPSSVTLAETVPPSPLPNSSLSRRPHPPQEAKHGRSFSQPSPGIPASASRTSTLSRQVSFTAGPNNNLRPRRGHISAVSISYPILRHSESQNGFVGPDITSSDWGTRSQADSVLSRVQSGSMTMTSTTSSKYDTDTSGLTSPILSDLPGRDLTPPEKAPDVLPTPYTVLPLTPVVKQQPQSIPLKRPSTAGSIPIRSSVSKHTRANFSMPSSVAYNVSEEAGTDAERQNHGSESGSLKMDLTKTDENPPFQRLATALDHLRSAESAPGENPAHERCCAAPEATIPRPGENRERKDVTRGNLVSKMLALVNELDTSHGDYNHFAFGRGEPDVQGIIRLDQGSNALSIDAIPCSLQENERQAQAETLRSRVLDVAGGLSLQSALFPVTMVASGVMLAGRDSSGEDVSPVSTVKRRPSASLKTSQTKSNSSRISGQPSSPPSVPKQGLLNRVRSILQPGRGANRKATGQGTVASV